MAVDQPAQDQPEMLFRVPSAVDLFPVPRLPSPKELHEWEKHPCTLMYLRLQQWEYIDKLKAATTTEQLSEAKGIQHAIEMEVHMRNTITSNELTEEEESGDNNADAD